MKSTNKASPPKRAVLYVRVSTDDQAKTGHSLQYQEKRLRDHCTMHEIEILEIFREDHSAKNFDRPAWKALLTYIAEQKGRVNLLLLLRYDRFTRNVEEGFTMLRMLRALNVQVEAIEQPVDQNTPESVLLRAIHMAIPEADNLRRSKAVTDGTVQARRDGRWTGKAPLGYRNRRDENRENKWIEPDDREPFVRKAFELIASGVSQAEALRRLRNKGVKCSTSQFQLMLRNPLYAGKIPVPPYDGEEAYLAEGQHRPIVTMELFLQVQDFLDGKSQNREYGGRYDEDFPFRGMLLCPICGSKLTASMPKGNGGRYPYYHCYKGCRVRYRAEVVHTAIEKHIEALEFKPEIIALYRRVYSDVVKANQAETRRRVEKIRRQLQVVRHTKDGAFDRFARGEVQQDEYFNAKWRYDEQIAELESEISRETVFKDGLLRQLEAGLCLLQQLPQIYSAMPPRLKTRTIGSIWPEKLVFDGEKVRTTRENAVIALLTNNDRGVSGSETKKAAEIGDLSRLVDAVGFEPTTSRV